MRRAGTPVFASPQAGVQSASRGSSSSQPVVWAPAVDGAIVLSQRGDDFRFVAGEDFAVGYAGHDGDGVRLYIEESFTFEIVEPRAAVSLRYPTKKR